VPLVVGRQYRFWIRTTQDRVLYATDLVVFPRSKTKDTLAEFRNTYARDWKYFSTDQKIEYMGHTCQGLAGSCTTSDCS
jgi:hypothetical protein